MRWAWGVLGLCLACDGGSTPGESKGSTSTAGSPTSTTNIDGQTSSSSSTTESAPVYTPQFETCRKDCGVAADCCPAGLEPCPSPDYPGNFGCVDGLCVPAPCETDAQCEAQIPGSSCQPVEGVPQCVVLCDEDDGVCAELGSGYTCNALTNEGQLYCRERCDLGTPCLLDTCNPDGVCECTSTDECISGFTCDAEAD